MMTFRNWFRNLFAPPIKQDASKLDRVADQLVFYSRDGDTYADLHSKVEILTRMPRGRIYGTTVVNGVIRFCLQIYPQVWQVLDDEQSKALEEKLKDA